MNPGRSGYCKPEREGSVQKEYEQGIYGEGLRVALVHAALHWNDKGE